MTEHGRKTSRECGRRLRERKMPLRFDHITKKLKSQFLNSLHNKASARAYFHEQLICELA